MLALFAWSTKSKVEEIASDPITWAVKRGILASQKGEYEESQAIFHKALEMANRKHSGKEIDDM